MTYRGEVENWCFFLNLAHLEFMISLSLSLYFCLKIDSFYKSAHMPYSLVFLFVLNSFFVVLTNTFTFLVFVFEYFIRPESDHWLVTNCLTNWLPFSRLDWCDPGMWRCQLKTCWCCYCCWCWWWGSCWQQFVADLEAEVWS